MARPASTQPTDAELEILNVLWDAQPEPLELGQICASLRKRRPDRAVATTTIASVLNVMLRKKLVRRKDGPRAYLWTPNADQRATRSGLVRKLLDHAFAGSPQLLVASILEDGRLGDQDREAIRLLLESDAARDRDGLAMPAGTSRSGRRTPP
jgi:predicted transcriptional regulator